MEKHDKIYWHEAFFTALQHELCQYKDFLEFDAEYRLSEEALRMDVLVIKKDKAVQIEKNIGRIFRGSNIFEFKSELDSFSVSDYFKVLGYAYLYMAFESVSIADITISVSLTKYPRELIKYLESECGFEVRNVSDGIYYVEGSAIQIQILESKKLPLEENLYLRNLRSSLSAEDMLKTLQAFDEVGSLDSRNAYLDRVIRANLLAFKEAIKMSEAVKYVFLETAEENGWLDDHAERYIHKGREEGREEGISLGEIKYCFTKLGRTVTQIAEEFGISEKDVIDALQQLQLA